MLVFDTLHKLKWHQSIRLRPSTEYKSQNTSQAFKRIQMILEISKINQIQVLVKTSTKENVQYDYTF